MASQKTARDVMQTQVLSVSPNDPLHTVQRLFYEEAIHGAPVIDETGRVIGMVTSTDVLRAAAEAHDIAPTEPSAFSDDLDVGGGGWGMAPEDFKARLQDTVVHDYMTEGAVEVEPDTPVSEVARQLRDHQIHRVLVVEDGKLSGIVSTFDLIGLLVEPA
jgi:CBS domain-containing protein